MSDKRKFPRADAIAVAKELCDILKPVTNRLVVAGSLRRMKREVGDIELLFIPKTRKTGLFGTDCEDEADIEISSWLTLGRIAQRLNSAGFATWGAKNKLAVHKMSGIPVDFFSTTEECWWNSLVCRTGGKDSNLQITTAAIKRGWSFEAYGSGFHNTSNGEHHQTTSEQDVFDFVGLPYREPKDRP